MSKIRFWIFHESEKSKHTQKNMIKSLINRTTEIDIPNNILRVDKYAFITFYGLMFKRANSNPLERK